MTQISLHCVDTGLQRNINLLQQPYGICGKITETNMAKLIPIGFTPDKFVDCTQCDREHEEE